MPPRDSSQRKKSKAKRRGVHGSHSDEQLWDLYVSQRASCAYCGCNIPMRGPIGTIDHIVPICRGGTNDTYNLCWACLSCNQSKGSLLLSEWDHPWLARSRLE